MHPLWYSSFVRLLFVFCWSCAGENTEVYKLTTHCLRLTSFRVRVQSSERTGYVSEDLHVCLKTVVTAVLPFHRPPHPILDVQQCPALNTHTVLHRGAHVSHCIQNWVSSCMQIGTGEREREIVTSSSKLELLTDSSVFPHHESPTRRYWFNVRECQWISKLIKPTLSVLPNFFNELYQW